MSIRLCGALAMLAIAPAFAATPINQSRPLNADGQVRIENIKGRIVVRTWSKPQVLVTGSLGKGVEKLEITGDARSLDIRVKYPDSRGGWNLWGRDDSRTEPTELEVMLPQRASVDVDAVSAEARAITDEYRAALRQFDGAPLPAQVEPSIAALDRSVAQIQSAIVADPDSVFLLEQLRRTYDRRLQLTQRAIAG